MAKWGEGDPRWIVEDRPDATNVNNWHWSEKNASSWSKDKISKLLTGFTLKKDGLGEVKISKVTSCEGEATANNRKGKLIFFYEWNIKADWEADLDDPDADLTKGAIEIPNLSDENDTNEVDVNVSVSSGGTFGEKVKDFLRKDGTVAIQNVLAEYLKTLREEYASDLLLPTATNNVNKTKTVINKKSDSSMGVTTTNFSNMGIKSDVGCKLDFKDLNLKQTFKCRVEDLYNVFTLPEMVTAFTRNTAKVNPVKDGAFEMFGGNILGTFQLLEPNKKVVQKWRFNTWPSGHYSTVSLEFSEKEDCTEITVKQTDIPSNDYTRTKEGWKNYYFESIKRTFGFGATLM